MTDVFLGIIALSVLLMAASQVAAVVMAARAARRVGEALGRLEETVRPIVANVEQMSADAVRATAIVSAQDERAEHMMDRVERIVDDVSNRVDETVSVLQDTILGPARSGMAIFQGLRAVLRAFFDRGRSRGPRAHGPSPEASEDDASFIG